MLVRESKYDEIFDAQRHFRVILDAMARPGKINTFPKLEIGAAEGISLGQAYVALSLLNADTEFCFSYESSLGAEYIIANTNAVKTALEQADFIFEDRPQTPHAVEVSKEGDPAYPETAATHVVTVDHLSDATNMPAGLLLELSGPGIEGKRNIRIDGPSEAWWNEIKLKNDEFPLGVDMMFVCDLPNGDVQIACIPRSSHINILK